MTLEALSAASVTIQGMVVSQILWEAGLEIQEAIDWDTHSMTKRLTRAKPAQLSLMWHTIKETVNDAITT